MEIKLKRPISFLLALVVAMVFNFPIGITSGITGIFDFGLPAKAEGTAGTITPTQPATGDGSSGNPYLIGTAAELYWFAGLVNGTLDGVTKKTTAHAKLTADITVNNNVIDANGDLVEGTSSFIPWTPIGNNSSNYTGTFDGDGHTISGLYFDKSDQSYVGLFGYLGNNGKIKNVGVIGSYFNGKSSVGGVCGENYCSATYYSNTIINCYNTSTVIGSGNYVGGVCGHNHSSDGVTTNTIENCYNKGKVTGSGQYVGGVSGCNYWSKVKNCYNTGAITSERSYNCNVGGVSGANENSSVIESCYNTGTVSGKSDFGSVCGYNYRSTIRNCYYRADSETDSLSGTTFKTDFGDGEVCYLLNGSTGTGDNLAWGQNVDSEPKDTLPVLKNSKNNAPPVYKVCDGTNFGYSNTNLGIKHDYSTGKCVCGEYQPADYNAEGDYYKIDTMGKLYWFAAQVNSGNNTINAKLTEDITVNKNVLKEDGTFAADENSFAVWTPIGNDSSKYAGTFDGDGHTISGLYFDNSKTEYVGLFGYVQKGTVKNVGVIDSYFNGKYYVGGVCGYNDGYSGTSTITSCYNTGTVSGEQNVGGVSGNNSGTITNCYNKGTVTGTKSDYVGGVSGSNNGTIENCYNAREGGNVCGTNSKTINNCYYLAESETDGISSTTFKTKQQFEDGEVCYLLNGSTAESERAWGQNVDSSKDALPVLKNSTNNAPAVYKYCTGTDFGYSNYDLGIKHDYSTGQCKCGEYQPASDSDDDTYYEIDTVGKLYWFAAQVNSGSTALNAKLTDNIDVNTNVIDANGKLANDTSGFTAWTPIGNDSYKYTGIFDGDGHTISGLYLSNKSQSYVGLFGYVQKGTAENSGTVKNVGVIDSYFNGKQYVGGVCGYNNNGKIENCYNKGIVKSISHVGGVCGYSNGTITSCYNTGAVTGTDDDTYVGGVCGMNYGTIENSYNTGAVTGKNYVGGVSGSLYSGTITSCYNTGAVKGTYSYVGGVIGYNSNGTITSCYYDSTVYTGGKAIGNKDDTDNVTGKDTDAFKNGEVCYLLNGSQSTSGLAWGQMLGGETIDTSPVFYNESNTVHKYCDGETFGYSNNNTGVSHSHKNNGICVCGDYEPASLNGGYYEIDNAGKLYWFAGLVNGDKSVCDYDADTDTGTKQNKAAKAKLMANITVNNSVINENGELNNGSFKAWTPIGNSSIDYQYTGEFDGAGHTISGLYFNDTNQSYIGLFGYVGSGGAVKNVGVIKSYFKGQSYIGGVIGYNDGGTITSCYNTGTVIGYNSAYTSQYVGGVIGYNDGGTITSCYNTGTVIGYNSAYTYQYVGGVIGYIYSGTITSCYNTGAVTGTSNGKSHVGGVSGSLYNGTITSCYNTGTITGNRDGYAGGVSGYIGLGSITSCYSRGTVKTASNIGGVSGYNDSGSITYCYYDSTVYENGKAIGNKVDTNEFAGKSTAEFASGKVCYLLNGSQSTSNLSWGQIIDKENASEKDAYPVFYDGENTVYLTSGCPVYSNAQTKDHVIGTDGICSDCKQEFVRFNAESNKVTGWTNEEVYQVLNGSEIDDSEVKTIELKDGTSLITCTFNHDSSITNVVYYTIEITQGENVIAETGKSKYNKTFYKIIKNIDMVQIAYMLENGDYTAILKLYDENENELYTKTMGFSVTDTAAEGNESSTGEAA